MKSSSSSSSTSKSKSKNVLTNLKQLRDSYNGISDLWGSPSNIEKQDIQSSIESKLISSLNPPNRMFKLKDLIPSLSSGAQVIVQDDLSLCFDTKTNSPWNWNIYLYILWILGVFLRYFILFPVRLFCFCIGISLFFIYFSLLRLLTIKDSENRLYYSRCAAKFLASVFTFSFTSVIKHHGVLPDNERDQIYVTNHTTMVDYTVLAQVAPFAVLAQKHSGWVGYLQSNIIDSLVGGVWFERDLIKDRKRTLSVIKKYINSDKKSRNRLLIFPEGTCVNNNFCVQFKRGAFEVGAAYICPIAIKYNDIFLDAYWNSRKKSFTRHLFDIMTSWALVCDIYFLEPQSRLENETASEFAQRVKSMICEAAQITDVDWNGYLKYFRPSARYVKEQQQLFAEKLKMRKNNLKYESSSPSNHEQEMNISPMILNKDHSNAVNLSNDSLGVTCSKCNHYVHINGSGKIKTKQITFRKNVKVNQPDSE